MMNSGTISRSSLVAAATALAIGMNAGCGRSDTDDRAKYDPAVRVVSAAELQAAIREGRAPLKMVHVWATWCPPCVEEFPELVELDDDPRTGGVEVLLLSADMPSDTSAVSEFLRQQNSPWDTFVADNFNEDILNLFAPDWSGAIPATFFFSSDGELLKWWSGAHSKKEYVQTIRELLDTAQD